VPGQDGEISVMSPLRASYCAGNDSILNYSANAKFLSLSLSRVRRHYGEPSEPVLQGVTVHHWWVYMLDKTFIVFVRYLDIHIQGAAKM